MTKAEIFQMVNRGARVNPPDGATAMVILVLFDDGSLCVHGGSDESTTEVMVAGAADMYGVGAGQVGALETVHDPFASREVAHA